MKRKNILVAIVPVAQRIRHLTTNQGIVGSNPTKDVFFKETFLGQLLKTKENSRAGT